MQTNRKINEIFSKKYLHYFLSCDIVTLALRKSQRNGPLAQLVEHLTLNQGVQGSSPWRSTESLKLSNEAGLGLIFLRFRNM